MARVKVTLMRAPRSNRRKPCPLTCPCLCHDAKGLPAGMRDEHPMTKAMYDLRRGDYMDFVCPNGHAQHYIKPTVDPRDAELVRLRKEVEDTSALAKRLQAEVDALKLEVEVWRPRAASETNGTTVSVEKSV